MECRPNQAILKIFFLTSSARLQGCLILGHRASLQVCSSAFMMSVMILTLKQVYGIFIFAVCLLPRMNSRVWCLWRSTDAARCHVAFVLLPRVINLSDWSPKDQHERWYVLILIQSHMTPGVSSAWWKTLNRTARGKQCCGSSVISFLHSKGLRHTFGLSFFFLDKSRRVTEESSTLFSLEICHSFACLCIYYLLARVTDSPAQMYAWDDKAPTTEWHW